MTSGEPLDATRMSRIEERKPVDVVVQIHAGDEVVASKIVEAEVLASRHWLVDLDLPNRSYEMLSLFPNRAAVATYEPEQCRH